MFNWLAVGRRVSWGFVWILQNVTYCLQRYPGSGGGGTEGMDLGLSKNCSTGWMFCFAWAFCLVLGIGIYCSSFLFIWSPASVSCSGNAPLGMSLSYRCSLLSAVKRLLLRGLGKSLNAIIRGTGVAHLRVNGFLRVGRSDTVLDHHHRHFLDSLNILYSSSLAIINEDWPSFRLQLTRSADC